MKHLLGNGFDKLRHTFYRNRHKNEHTGSRPAELVTAVETVVDGTDSKIRLVPGYKKKLQNIVQPALEYCDDLVNQIPEAIEVNRSTFSSNPYVNAFFTNISDLQSIFSQSSEIRDYMETSHEDDGCCCALLCMKKTEKTVFGMELSGDMLNREVPQTAVSFSDHRIYSPTPSETETRDGLRNCLFQGLATNALGRIVKLKLDNHQLQGRYQMLHARLRRYMQQIKEVEQGSRTAVRLAHDIEETRRELVTTEQAMLDAPLPTPQVALDQVVSVFAKPDEFVRFRKLPLRLNKMGIKIREDSPQADNTLNLTEALIGNEAPRIVTLATFPRRDLLPRPVFSING